MVRVRMRSSVPSLTESSRGFPTGVRGGRCLYEGSYGGTELIALEVHFPDGRHQLFWPGDLEAVASPKPWWHSSLLGRRRS